MEKQLITEAIQEMQFDQFRAFKGRVKTALGNIAAQQKIIETATRALALLREDLKTMKLETTDENTILGTEF